MATPSTWTLTRWLGPWAAANKSPDGVERREIELDAGGERPLRAWFFVPERRKVRGALVIVPGVHYNGPDDPRMDRFARILGAAGIASFIPFLPDYMDLVITPRVAADLDRAFAAALEQPETAAFKPGLLSISFGSFPALRVASDPARADQVGALIVFGGYADFRTTVRFCMTGEIDGKVHARHDPLNQPVGFVNLVPWMDGAPEDPSHLIAGWQEFCRRTWGRDEMKEDEARRNRVAEEVADELNMADRELFLIGCRARPGGPEMADVAMQRATQHADDLDPRAHMHTMKCPVTLVHGIHDDVIPYTQMAALTAALPPRHPVNTHLTGLFGHTATSGLLDLLRLVPSAVREIFAMSGIVRAISRSACVRRR